ncbi:hypothetical protein GCM10027047_24930 [Rhodococcus aerolatus]
MSPSLRRRRPVRARPRVSPWLLRAVVLAPVHAAVSVGVGLLAAEHPEQGSWLRLVALGLLLAVALVWGTWDGTREARATDDLSARWLKAGLAAGPVAAFAAWLVRVLAVDATGLESLWGQLTGGASFTALMVLVPAVVGVVLGRWLVASPRAPRAPRRGRRQSSTDPVDEGASRAMAE